MKVLIRRHLPLLWQLVDVYPSHSELRYYKCFPVINCLTAEYRHTQHESSLMQCFSTFVRPRPGKFFFHKTRARFQQIYIYMHFCIKRFKLVQTSIVLVAAILQCIGGLKYEQVWRKPVYFSHLHLKAIALNML